jgi:hypothetical protein
MTSKPQDVPVPARLTGLPRDHRGFVVFFTITPPPGRELSFRAINPQNVRRCGKARLCGICGQPLDYRFWFLGSAEDLDRRVFGEPPMHRECLDYALAVCPFLSGHYRPTHRLPEGPYELSKAYMATRLDRMVLYQTRGFKLGVDRDHSIFRADPPTAVEWRDGNGRPFEALSGEDVGHGVPTADA